MLPKYATTSQLPRTQPVIAAVAAALVAALIAPAIAPAADRVIRSRAN